MLCIFSNWVVPISINRLTEIHNLSPYITAKEDIERKIKGKKQSQLE